MSAIYQTVACQQLVWAPISRHFWDRLALAQQLAEGCSSVSRMFVYLWYEEETESIPVM
jgi:hypothetical protein